MLVMDIEMIQQIGGILLILLVLLDVFLTVLYTRMGTGLVSRRMGNGIWHCFRVTAQESQGEPRLNSIVLRPGHLRCLHLHLDKWSLLGNVLLIYPAPPPTARMQTALELRFPPTHSNEITIVNAPSLRCFL
jgi:hypothetical protein